MCAFRPLPVTIPTNEQLQSERKIYSSTKLSTFALKLREKKLIKTLSALALIKLNGHALKKLLKSTRSQLR